MTGPVIPSEVIERQFKASDPAISAWVSANAGSGKTHVLAQRVIRLLLSGCDPAKILCLTFTKAAAANMANRVLSTLAAWTALDDAALDESIRKVEGKPPPPERRLRARRLFAQALETPGGLKVQTIHAFCTSLLHQFPFEAGVAAAFEVLEDRAEKELIDRLRLEVLLEAAAAPQSPLGRALSTAIATSADTTFASIIREAIGQRAALEGWIDQAGGLDAALAELSRTLGIAPDETIESIEAAFLASPIIARSEWPALSAIFAQGSTNDQKNVERLARAQAGESAENVDAYLDIFCTQDRSPRKNILTKKLETSNPEWADLLAREQTRLGTLIERRRAAIIRDRSAALITVAHTVLQRYRAEKNRLGQLDYDDLIEKTLTLFNNAGSAWVHYKLDLGIDHVLIDEAQDTSPQQWEVILRLTDEFTAGEGARSNVRRSIFAVGDEKQSIYSFQGAAPHRFDEMRRHFARAHDAAELAFAGIQFRYSFRSAPDVLGAVDAVFERPEAFTGLSSDNVRTVHEAVRSNAPGCVELWAVEEPEPKADPTAWDAPFDTRSEQNPRVKLAQRIAAYVRNLIARGELIEDKGTWRRATPGDFLVLVRQRGGLFEAIIRALKDAEVEVAGADRLVLGEHIAVMDLMSLADALLLPEHDLALAEALKSPLFGFDDDDLFAVAYGRRGSLRAALRAKAAEKPLFANAAEQFDALAALARTRSPFAFYAELLGARGGRRAILRRLGPEANDALDEFLALALEYERRHTPSLQGFVAWLRDAETEVKRDMDIVRDEVRVMTVHGAKGLEAPIVILADTTGTPEGPYPPKLLKLASSADRDQPAPIVWAPSRKEDVEPVAEARQQAVGVVQDEHRRLLYVAMTRAADRLVVCGARGRNKLPEACWHNLVQAALTPNATRIESNGDAPPVWLWQKSDASPPEVSDVPAETPHEQTESETPRWLAEEASPSPPKEVALAPSRAGEAARGGPGRQVPSPEARAALARGLRVHRLLQVLPTIPAERRADAARIFLARPPDAPDDSEREAIIAQVMGVLADPSFASLFAPGTRAEAPITGRLARAEGPPLRISGLVDRLAVTADTVLIADFKTDRAPPERAEDVPDSYVTQLALYRAVLGRLYTDRKVRAALIYTEKPALIEIPGSALDAALTRLNVQAA